MDIESRIEPSIYKSEVLITTARYPNNEERLFNIGIHLKRTRVNSKTREGTND